MRRFDLSGKVGIVTGGNGGIGSGIARGLLECGAAILIAGRDAEKNAAMVKELSALGSPVSAYAMDVTDEAQCQALVRETIRRHGRLDILVNNAGLGSGGKLPHELTLADWHRVMDTNLTSAFVLSQLAYSEMKRGGGGKIINIGSMASHLAMGRLSVYASAKAAIVQLSRTCASAWAKDNIQVNTILPGYIDTAMAKGQQADAGLHTRALARIAAGRLGTPDDFAGIAAFLASSASDYVTGADIPVDGGFLWGI